MATIYLVRHGQASFGQHDYDKLSPIGEQQAVVTGEWLKAVNKPIALFGSGTLLRQRQTLSGIYSGMGLEGRQPDFTLPGLNEVDVDELLLVANPQFTSRREMDSHMANKSNPAQAFFELYRSSLARWAGGEHDQEYKQSWPEFKEKALNAVTIVGKELKENENVLLVSSGGTISTLVLQVLGMPENGIFKLNRHINNASITALHFRKNKLSLHGFNNYAHLEQAGSRRLITRI
ncbi:histidine phosphatase family protein [Parendozoicomonas sp. Alg238-R29]|uniref:histidine phosphatase family protein n=1 Tax=Parendozoicomonas sp. Alg238-R29 TaxID=2993446 RepID=UPI00248EE156|nr:histidine phosphatase family protein [Parendozoicomonas sp. Alg238-R29]